MCKVEYDFRREGSQKIRTPERGDSVRGSWGSGRAERAMAVVSTGNLHYGPGKLVTMLPTCLLFLPVAKG